MPKRVIDFDAMWASDKIAACAEWAQAEYAWLYGLADASGCFELTNLRVIWGRVSAIRKNLTLERLAEIIEEFHARGLLFTWEENGKRYGHWTGSDVPGRLPAPSWRARLERLAPPVPEAELAAYCAQFASRRGALACEQTRHATKPAVAKAAPDTAKASYLADSDLSAGDTRAIDLQLNLGLELPQAQDGNWDLNLNRNQDESGKPKPMYVPAQLNSPGKGKAERDTGSPEQLLEIYDTERGSLPCAERLTVERRRQCVLRLAAGLSTEEFAQAVRRAAQTPFLAGGGDRGWRANFDWFVANDTNVRRVLEGCYEPHGAAANFSRTGERTPAALYAGAAPPAALCGVRVKPATLERIRAREAAAGAARLPTTVRDTRDDTTRDTMHNTTRDTILSTAQHPPRDAASVTAAQGAAAFVRESRGSAATEHVQMNEPLRAQPHEATRREKAS